jgi:hypothetical protein
MNVTKVTRDYASVFYVNTRQHLYERDNNNNTYITRVRPHGRAHNNNICTFSDPRRARIMYTAHYYIMLCGTDDGFSHGPNDIISLLSAAADFFRGFYRRPRDFLAV